MPDADTLLSRIQTEVTARRERLDNQRRERLTLADRVKLFEKAWQRGQRERSKDTLPSRILGRNVKLLKDQILRPMEGLNIDPEEFAYWVAANWDSIGNRHFTKSKRYPENPAFPWLIACLDTYMTAYNLRDERHENIQGMSRAELMRKAENYEIAIQRADHVTKSTQTEIAVLKAELAVAKESLQRAKETGRVEKDAFKLEREREIKTSRAAVLALPDYDDFYDDGTKRRRKLRKHRT